MVPLVILIIHYQVRISLKIQHFGAQSLSVWKEKAD